MAVLHGVNCVKMIIVGLHLSGYVQRCVSIEKKTFFKNLTKNRIIIDPEIGPET